MRAILTLGVVAWVVAVLVVFTMARGESASAANCTTTLAAAANIQTAVDAAVAGDVVCLSTGTYSQSVVFSGTAGGGDDSGITLRAAGGASPVLDGTGPADAGTTLTVDAIRLLDGVSSVAIEGLAIRDYSNIAIDGDGTVGTPLSDINLKNLDIDEIGFHAIDVLHTAGFGIKDSSITTTASPFATFGEAIRLQSVTDVKVRNVDVDGGFIGVNFACTGPCSSAEPPTNGSVQDSTFTNNFIGVLIANSDGAVLKGNEVEGAFRGIRIGFAGNAAGVTGTVVNDNWVHDNDHGIVVWAGDLALGPGGDPGAPAASAATSDIVIIHNLVTDNATDGIVLVNTDGSKVNHNVVTDNGGNGIAFLFGSTGNKALRNTATGNDAATTPLFAGSGTADLFHDGTSTPNKWLKNTCGTKIGADINSC